MVLTTHFFSFRILIEEELNGILWAADPEENAMNFFLMLGGRGWDECGVGWGGVGAEGMEGTLWKSLSLLMTLIRIMRELDLKKVTEIKSHDKNHHRKT